MEKRIVEVRSTSTAGEYKEVRLGGIGSQSHLTHMVLLITEPDQFSKFTQGDRFSFDLSPVTAEEEQPAQVAKVMEKADASSTGTKADKKSNAESGQGNA
jgi:hypothetical protein